MDSLSQFVLGASVAAAALGARTKAWRPVLWGGVLATLPDLDVLIDHGDAVLNMTRHRATSHALFWLSLAAPVLAAGIVRLHRDTAIWRRWWLAAWLALVTHPLLDAMTIYGTRFGLPFTEHPFAVGSLFVIDPLYTLPLLLGAGTFLVRQGDRAARRAVGLGLLLSTAYAGWSVAAQQWVTGIAAAELRRQGVVDARLVVSAAPLQTLLWRIVALTPTRAYEGLYSLCDRDTAIDFTVIDRGAGLQAALAGAPAVQRLVHLSQDACKLHRDGDAVVMSDLRMGHEPNYVFAFVVGEFLADGTVRRVEPTRLVGGRIPVGAGLPWLWRRMWGDEVPPPR